MRGEVDSAVKQMVISLPLKTTKFLIFYFFWN